MKTGGGKGEQIIAVRPMFNRGVKSPDGGEWDPVVRGEGLGQSRRKGAATAYL